MTYTDLFTQLLRAEIELWNSLDRHLLAAAGVSVPTFQALSAIDKLAEPVRVQDISEEMSITVGATSKVVDRLERDGLVKRESNPGDRRSSNVVLTTAGRASLSAAATAAESYLRGLLSASFTATRAESLTADLASVRVVVGAAQ
jgi:DNA-binding MarR family transcriptional regulator